MSKRSTPAIANTFVEQFQLLCKRLEQFPLSFPIDRNPIRRATLRRFSKYLVFYREAKGGIRVIRILHGMRDLPSLLG